MGDGVIRVEIDGGAVAVHGLLQAFRFLQREPQVTMGFGVFRG